MECVMTNKGVFKIRYVYKKGDMNVIVINDEKNEQPFTGTYGDELPMLVSIRDQYQVVPIGNFRGAKQFIESFNNACFTGIYQAPNGKVYASFTASSFAKEGIEKALGEKAINTWENKYRICIN